MRNALWWVAGIAAAAGLATGAWLGRPAGPAVPAFHKAAEVFVDEWNKGKAPQEVPKTECKNGQCRVVNDAADREQSQPVQYFRGRGKWYRR